MKHTKNSRIAGAGFALLALSACDPQRDADRQAWASFAESSRPVKAAGTAAADSPVAWRLWWTEQEVYRAFPPNLVYTGPQRTATSDHFRPLACNAESERLALGVQAESADGSSPCEAIFFNEPAAGYIFYDQLWDRRKLIKQAASGGVHLPAETGRVSREMKTEWRPILAERAKRYISALDKNGNLYGLVAFHMMSHDLPNWLWATWLHEDYSWKMPLEIGFHDSFGAKPDKTPSDALIALLAANQAEVLRHYRLIGTQRSFTTPSALGNPMIEGSAADTLRHSSCMSCHVQAAVSYTGDWIVHNGVTGPTAAPHGYHSTDFDSSLTLRAACVPGPGPCVQLLLAGKDARR